MDEKFKADRVVRIYHDPEMMVWPENLLLEIAARLEEIPDDWLIDAGKKEVPAGNGKWLIEPLTSADLKVIREICGGNPPMRGTNDDFEQFEATFNEAAHRPEWTLSLKRRPSDDLVKARNRYNDVMITHRAQMERLAHDGTIRLTTPTGIDTHDLDKGRLHVEDVKAYLARCHLAYRVLEHDMPAADDNEDSDDANRPDVESRVAWRESVKKQWGRMLEAHKGKCPPATKVLAWFKANDHEGTFKPGGSDEEFFWVGADGTKTHKTGRKAFSNAIAEMKKRGEIPA